MSDKAFRSAPGDTGVAEPGSWTGRQAEGNRT